MKHLAKESMLWLGLILSAVLVGGTVYQMMVIVPEFNRDIPNGMIALARSTVSTKTFWTSPIMPLGFLAMILALVFNWKNARKNWLLGAVLLGLSAEIITILFVFPMLRIMGVIDGNPAADTGLLTQTIRRWILVDQLRFWLLIIPSFLLYMKAFSIPVARK